MNVMRTNLYIPANNPVFVGKCAKYPADNVTFDVEDAVPPQEKAKARQMAADNLKAAGANGASVYVRVNGWHILFIINIRFYESELNPNLSLDRSKVVFYNCLLSFAFYYKVS